MNINGEPRLVAADLSVLAYANGFTVWHIREVELLAKVLRTPDYLADVQDLVKPGDHVHITADCDSQYPDSGLASVGWVPHQPADGNMLRLRPMASYLGPNSLTWRMEHARMELLKASGLDELQRMAPDIAEYANKMMGEKEAPSREALDDYGTTERAPKIPGEYTPAAGQVEEPRPEDDKPA